MRTVKGRYDGKVVVLDEPVPVQREVEVIVHIPEDTPDLDTSQDGPPKEWHWEESRRILSGLGGGVSEELLRQRGHGNISPGGLPPLPAPEELKARAARLRQMVQAWVAEGPADDLATWEELKEGLKQNPVRLREVRTDE